MVILSSASCNNISIRVKTSKCNFKLNQSSSILLDEPHHLQLQDSIFWLRAINPLDCSATRKGTIFCFLLQVRVELMRKTLPTLFDSLYHLLVVAILIISASTIFSTFPFYGKWQVKVMNRESFESFTKWKKNALNICRNNGSCTLFETRTTRQSFFRVSIIPSSHYLSLNLKLPFKRPTSSE